MLRTDAADHDTNMFTDGNPVTSTPATVMDSKWCNDKQEELVGVVEGQGIVADQTGADQQQLRQALGHLNLSQVITNNEASPTDITGLVFDKTIYKAIRALFSLDRNTTTNELVESGELFIMHREKTDDWIIRLNSHGDDAGVTFTVTGAGQVQYISTDVTGASYSGNVRINHIHRIVQ